MVQMDVITSLKIVKEELDSNITKASAALEHFAINTQSVQHLSECQELLRQASSVLKLLELDGATHLLNEMIFLLKQIQTEAFGSDSTRFMEQMACLGLSLIQLEHFLEYSLLRERHVPLLLSGSINSIRRLLCQSPMPDFVFLRADLEEAVVPSLVQLYELMGDSVEKNQFMLENLGPSCKPFRLMFQVGLLATINENKVLPGPLNLMNRALKRLCGICGPVPLTRLWFLVRAALIAFQYGSVSITSSRIFMLTKVERQIKQLVYGRDDLLLMDPPEHLLNECLGVIALASVEDDTNPESARITALQNALKIRASISDKALEEELRLMNGPTGTVIQSVTQLIYDELAPLKVAMDYRGRQKIPEWNQERTPEQVVEQTAHTLNMIGELESAAILREQLPVITQLFDSTVQPAFEHLQSLADIFVLIEQALAKLLGRYSVEMTEDNNLTPLGVLEQARHLVFVESRASLNVVKRAITSYVDSVGDRHYLDQVASHLESSVGALRFLHLDRVAQVLETSLSYMLEYLVQEEQMPTDELLEILADVLTSVDYYLESLEDSKSIGEGVLEAAELSVNILKKTFKQDASHKVSS